ncbi:hypothetical protein [Leptospira sp. GIMC2001]|uniref:hypothetical protein n=1 Tax=Leptospira sp. GIMC2001 TaxID=1513297 RepID=UPI00234A02BA|nr:hypothetical protein [Leptospira sp. GIMC2001]WCL50412.1 hypothetical protein O4O04_06220 [Leptospira sp. GIMC2001]
MNPKNMVASGIWVVLLVIFGYKVFSSNKNDYKSLLFSTRKAILQPLAPGNWVFIIFYLLILLSPLVFGLAIYLRTDANVVVVLVFYVWLYQWIKAVWNSYESMDDNPS